MNIKYKTLWTCLWHLWIENTVPLEHTEIINYCLLKSIATYYWNCNISLNFPVTQRFINLHSVLKCSITKKSFNLTSQLSASCKIFQIFLWYSVRFGHVPYNLFFSSHMAFSNVCKSVFYWPSKIIILHDQMPCMNTSAQCVCR